MGGACLGYLRKQADQAMDHKPGSSSALVLPFRFLFEFLPWLPFMLDYEL